MDMTGLRVITPGQDSDEGEKTSIPYSLEAEQQLLGALLTNNDVFDRVSQIIKGDHFYHPVHARIFDICGERIRKNALASPVTIKAFLENDEGLKELGGPAYLARMASAAISAYAARDYAQMIREFALRRELMQLGQDITARASMVEVGDEAEEQIKAAEQTLYKLGEQGVAERGFQSFLKAVTGAVQVANAAYQRDGKLSGISTGLVDLDGKMGGLNNSDLIILAGRPSMGKTSLATNIAFNIAKAGRKARRHPRLDRGRRRRLLQPRDVGRTAGRPHPVRGRRGAVRAHPQRQHGRGRIPPLRRGRACAAELSRCSSTTRPPCPSTSWPPARAS